MGYELHIVRDPEWWIEGHEGGIPLDDWIAYLNSDSSMRLDGNAVINLPDGSNLGYSSDGLAVWTNHAGNVEGGSQAWFDFRDNRIVVKSPDQEILAKMLSIANRLSAIVVGDEGEEYKSATDHGIESCVPPGSTVRRRWWRFW